MPLVKVTAELASPIALSPTGHAPNLDALCCLQMCRHLGSIKQSEAHNIQPRGQRITEQGQIPIPIKQTWIDGFPIPHCSSGIIEATSESVDYYHCSFPTHRGELLRDDQRTKIARGGGTYKSFRLPLRKSDTQRVVWFAELRTKREVNRAPASWLRQILSHVEFIGKKTAYGHGHVATWTVEPTDIEAHWICDGVLMRPLPVSMVAGDVVGKRRSFGAVADPYWQADFFTDCYVPC